MSVETGITATEDTVQRLLSRDYKFVVPEYQRQYSWQEDQWEEFWSDLQKISNQDTHFLGSIVVVEEQKGIDKKNELKIVDGQQRLTTISVLMCAIRDRHRKNGNESAVQGINNEFLFLMDNDYTNESQKLSLNSLDDEQYRRLVNNESMRESESNLKRAAEYFADKLSGFSDDDLSDLRKKLAQRMTLVTIQCDNQESAFRLFETLNDRGLELSATDLMKNHLYQKASRESLGYESIQNDWESIIDGIRYELNKPYRFFVHYLLYAPEPEVTKSISKNTLYNKFKELINKQIPNSEISIQTYIRRMADDVRLYLQIINAEVDKFDSKSNSRINRQLAKLSRLGYTQERTYLMGVFKHLDSATSVVRALELIESFIVRHRFTSSITGSSLNELYAEICSHAFSRDDPIAYIRSRLADVAPSDDEVEAALASNNFSRSDRTLFLLEGIEANYYRTGSSVVPSGEIEHIAPRQSFTAVKYNTWPDHLDVSKERFNEYKDRLGNLTILEKRLNISASDNPFSQKKAEYKESNYAMAQSLTEYDSWSVEEIRDRTERLASAATDIWSFEV